MRQNWRFRPLPSPPVKSASAAVQELRLLLGIERNTTGHGEKLVSGIGAALGILTVYGITCGTFGHGTLPPITGLIMVASMGASAVLLFAVPQGALSQPWAVIGGHLVSATIGVSCQKLFPGHAWTAALAVGLAVGAMHYLRCIHPPGGATALAAVIGGAEIHALGYGYLLVPVGINMAAILLMAVAFNALFPWRRYPAHLHRRRATSVAPAPASRQFELTQEDFSAAMEQLNSYVDITTENLTELLELAKQHAERNITHPRQISAGSCYSNGRFGAAWSVREVLAPTPELPARDQVAYRVVAGAGLGQLGQCPLEEFRQWARFQVRPQTRGHWVKVD
jgi:CBS domain-containing membrane protein